MSKDGKNDGQVLELYFGGRLSKVFFGDRGDDALLVGVKTSIVTKCLREIFGGNEVKIQVQIRNLKQGKNIRSPFLNSSGKH